ncbi:MAG: NusG domain II-containing protein [Christensenellales bacterium]
MKKVDKVSRVRSLRPFKKADVIVYIVLAVVIVALVLAFCLPRKNSLLTGIEIKVSGKVAASYDFDRDEIFVGENVEFVSVQGGYEITVHVGGEYNVIFVDVIERKARITSADCSSSADCTTMSEITKAGDSIICVPHQLVVAGLGEEEIKPPVSG